VAGVGTALVLTGGNLYLAHAIARVRRWRRMLGAVWLAVLASSGGLVVPLVAAGLIGRTLPQLLGGEGRAWGWSLLAALADEVTAAGCVLAAAAVASERTAAERSQAREVDELLRQRHAARQELAEVQRQCAGRELTAAGSGARAGARELTPLQVCPEGCGRSFAGARALGGHLRHCAARRERLRLLAASET
jgi:MFS family permease